MWVTLGWGGMLLCVLDVFHHQLPSVRPYFRSQSRRLCIAHGEAGKKILVEGFSALNM